MRVRLADYLRARRGSSPEPAAPPSDAPRDSKGGLKPEYIDGEEIEVDSLLMTEPGTTADDRHYIGPIKLGVGILPRHVAAIAYVSLSSVIITNFFSLMQPHILAQRLHLAKSLLGRTGGELALTQNLAVLVFTIIFGALADRVRGNRFMAWAYAGMAVSCILYPLSSTLTVLMAIIFLLGISQTITLTASQAHGLQYPDNASRGKYGSMMSILNIGGVMLISAQFGPRLPEILQRHGISPETSLRDSFWIFSLFVAPATFVSWYLLKQDPPVQRVGSFDLKGEIVAIGRNLVEVLRYSRINRRFQLVLIISLFMRSDFAVVSTFLSLWVTAAGRARGVDTTASVTHAGQMYSVILVTMFIAMFLVGLLLDRINRVVLLLCALGCVALAYTTPLLVKDVFAMPAYGCAALIGFAEGFIVITLSALIGQEAPAHLRGAAVGIINLIAIIGVSTMNYTGGILFDKISHVAPFVMMALLNLVTFVWGLSYIKHR